MSILRLQSVKIGGSLTRNAHFPAATCLVSSLVFLWPRHVYVGKLQNLSFSKVSKQVVMSFCVAGVALCNITTCLITCRKCHNWRKSRTKCSFSCDHVSRLEMSRVSGFPVASPCLWGKLPNLSFSKVSKQVVMSFCVAGVALCNITTCLITCRKCHNWRKSRTKCSFSCDHVSRLEMSRVSGFPVASPCLWGKLPNLSFSKVSKQVVMSFCVAGVALCDIPTCFIPCRKFFYVAGATMHTTLYTLHFTLHTLHSTLYTPHSTLYTPHSTTLYTLSHSTLLTPHFTLHTPHSTLNNSTLYTLHFTLYTLHSTLYSLHPTLYTLHSTLHTLNFTLHTLHSTLYTLHFALHTLQFTPYTLHSTLYTPHSSLYTPHSTLYTFHSTLSTPHSTLYTFHSTLQTGNRGNRCKTVQINYCRKVFGVTAYPCVSTSVPLTCV